MLNSGQLKIFQGENGKLFTQNANGVLQQIQALPTNALNQITGLGQTQQATNKNLLQQNLGLPNNANAQATLLQNAQSNNNTANNSLANAKFAHIGENGELITAPLVNKSSNNLTTNLNQMRNIPSLGGLLKQEKSTTKFKNKLNFSGMGKNNNPGNNNVFEFNRQGSQQFPLQAAQKLQNLQQMQQNSNNLIQLQNFNNNNNSKIRNSNQNINSMKTNNNGSNLSLNKGSFNANRNKLPMFTNPHLQLNDSNMVQNLNGYPVVQQQRAMAVSTPSWMNYGGGNNKPQNQIFMSRQLAQCIRS